MHARTLHALLALSLGACGGPARTASTAARDRGAAASAAVLAQAAARPWIRITPQGTSMCLRLPDGSFHHVVYAVGGSTDGFVFRTGAQVPVTRDLVCSDYGVLALGDRGVVSAFDEQGLRPQGAFPTARAMFQGPGWTCFLDGEGALFCDGSARPGIPEGLGPIAELLGDRCARYRDGRVACSAGGATPPHVVLWRDTRQASVSGGVSCAVLASGQVSCLGDNRFAQRGFAGPAAAEPTLVPGLDGVDEVHTSGAHVCARRGGEVWCWGQAGDGQAGEAALEASTQWPRCKVDREATARAEREHAEAVATCRGPRPDGDDPFCRGMSGSYVEKVYRGNPGFDCDPAGATRFAPPTRVDGLDDAIALAARGSMTCALRADRTLRCWGNGARAPKELAITPGPLPVERAYAVPPRGPSVEVNEGGVIVRVAAGALAFHPWLDGPLRAGRPLTGALDAILAPGVCTLAAGGAVRCEAAFDAPARTGNAPPGFDRFAGGAPGCFGSPEGALQCAPAGGGWGPRFTAAGDVVEAHPGCARYADGVVRCLVTPPGTQAQTLTTVLTDAVSLSVPLWPLTMCAVKARGEVWCIGGEFDPKRDPGPTPVAIVGAPPGTAVAASPHHACLLAADGTVWCWGRATEGQAGELAHARAEVTPACPVDLDATVEARHRTLEARPECFEDEALPDCRPIEYAWVEGCEPPGPHGTTRRQLRPVQVPGVTGVVAIGAGSGRTCALTRTGLLQCWGSGSARVQTVGTIVRGP